MVETALLDKNKTQTTQFQQNVSQEFLDTKQTMGATAMGTTLSSSIDTPYENVPLSSTVPASVTSMATGSTIPVSSTYTIPMTSTLPSSTIIGGSTLPTTTFPAATTTNIPTSTMMGGSTIPTSTFPTSTLPASTLPVTTTTTGKMSKWKRRREAKKLRKQQQMMGVTNAPVATTTGGPFGKEVGYTMNEKFYSMPVLAGQPTPFLPGSSMTTGGPKLTRKEKRAWKKREKKENAALNTSMAGMSLTDRKLLHDLKHDKLGPIHPAATQQPPVAVTTTTTTEVPVTTTTTTFPTTATSTSNVIGTTPVMNI